MCPELSVTYVSGSYRTPPRRGIVEFILSHFVLIAFHLFRYFQDRPPCCFAAPSEDENQEFDLPWQVATLIK